MSKGNNKEEITQEVQSDNSGPGYLEVVGLILVVSGLMIAGYHKYFAQKITVVDLKGFVQVQRALLKTGQLKDGEFKKKLELFDRRLSREARNNPNTIYLPKGMVLKNGREIQIQ